jgi:Tfp pilus assembly protein PilX
MRIHMPRLSSESGFTLIVVLGVMVVASLLMAGAFVAANGDIHLTQTDTNGKKAYYAAQAGISQYVFHLNEDVNYWTYCTEGNAALNHALNQYPSTEHKLPVPGASEEEYAITLLPATTNHEAEPKCNKTKPVESMIENGSATSGTFRIASTGYSGNQKRTIVATFGHEGFLDFIYYTQYETLDPVTYNPVEPKCEKYYGERPEPPCARIDFVSADHVNGPMHTQDNASICGTPTFGRKPSDRIEFYKGYRESCGGSGPIFKGTDVTTGIRSITPPPSDATLKSVVEAAYHYEGKTAIVLGGSTMQVTHYTENTVTHAITTTTESNVPFPANGLIYVSNNTSPKPSCGVTYSPYGPSYTKDVNCGNVYVEGNYTGQLTIASENDVVIDGNITTPVNGEGIPTSNAVLGLIADNFVRVYHPLNGHRTVEECENSTNADPALKNITIYAAILAVNHSFIVDNYDCGEPMEKLTVFGAIAQVFRGTVGTHDGSGNVASGYAKNYNYDDRLRVESPPYFLNPVQAAWLIQRETLAEKP